MFRWPLNSFVALALVLFVSSFSRAATNDPGAEIFAPNAPILRIKVEISKENWNSLRRDARKPVPAIVREGENVYSNVMVHCKGAAGSFRDIDSNPSLTLSFSKTNQSQRFHDLHKIHLNNSVQDPSQSTYLISSMMFNAVGVPAARVTNARFTLNNRDMGMYVVVEGFTKDFLKRYFSDTKGNFYDGGFCQDINAQLQREMGEGEDTQADLKALVSACNSDPAQRWPKLQKLLDVDRFVNFMVIENFTWDWDGYMPKPNNYRVYHDPSTDKMTFIPHGMDQMFWDAHGQVWRPQLGGMVAQAIMETPEGAKLYHDRVKTVFEKAFRIDEITSRLDQLTARNRPAAAEVGHGFIGHWQGAVADTRNRIIERYAFVKDQIENEPKPLDFSKPVLIKSWHEQVEMGSPRLDRADSKGKQSLHIVANGQSTASWRSNVQLDSGKYRFSVMARTAKLSPMRDSKGEGAGIRISGSMQPRRNSISGDTDWTKLQYDFEVQGGQSEVVLICESRAKTGEVWFDMGTLMLEKLR